MSREHTERPAERILHPLEPVFDSRSRVLILGTMPSPKSRDFTMATPRTVSGV